MEYIKLFNDYLVEFKNHNERKKKMETNTHSKTHERVNKMNKTKSKCKSSSQFNKSRKGQANSSKHKPENSFLVKEKKNQVYSS